MQVRAADPRLRHLEHHAARLRRGRLKLFDDEGLGVLLHHRRTTYRHRQDSPMAIAAPLFDGCVDTAYRCLRPMIVHVPRLSNTSLPVDAVTVVE